MIRFRQIEAFRHLMATGTTVAAARQLHISQPAISRLVADLETDLGFKLFNRSKGRLEPTMAAVRFQLAVEENFLGLERLRKAAETIRLDENEGLSIACMPVLSTSLLPLILKEFRKTQPDTPLKIDSVSNADVLFRLQNLKVDVAICLAFPAIAGIEVEPLLSTKVLCALPAGHRLCDKPFITAADLAGEDMIGWTPSSPISPSKEDLYFPDSTKKPNFLIRTHTSHTRYAMVANGFGVSIVESFGHQVWAQHGVVVKPYITDSLHSYVLAYPSTGRRSGLVQKLRTATLKVVQNPDLVPWRHHEKNSKA